MSKRFVIALVGLIVVVGPLFVYMLYHRYKNIRLVQNLLSLPKERRFFWYLLRKNGFRVLGVDVMKTFSLEVDGQVRQYKLKLDFLLVQNRNRYGGVFGSNRPTSDGDERDLMKIFFIFCHLYQLDGIVFYQEDSRSYELWKF